MAKSKNVKKKVKSAEKIVQCKSKRKRSIARATIRDGNGIVRINSKLIDTIEPEFIRDQILAPINFSDLTKGMMSNLNVSVNVYGGGISSQAQASASAIAKAIVEYSGDAEIKREYLDYNRNLLKDDQRRVEPKKFLGPKARARFQTSYR